MTRTAAIPCCYLLHGANSDAHSWTRDGDAEAITGQGPDDRGHARWRSDGLVHRLVPGRRPVQPRWETYHVGELIPWIDATYRTIAARRGRAIAGLSMGGYGALSYAARHPGTFVAAASFSGAVEIGSSDAWGERSANPARWRAHLPISIAQRLRSLALIELFTGDGRPGPLDRRGTKPNCPGCALGALPAPRQRAPARAAECARDPPRLARLRPGTHDWPYWRRDLRATLPTSSACSAAADARLAPDLARRLDDQLELGPLLVVAQRVALDGGGEAALPREAELLDVDVAAASSMRRLSVVLALELAALGRDQAEDDELAGRHEAQRLEAARAGVVVLEEEAVDLEVVEERLGDVVVAALRHPRGLEVAAAQVAVTAMPSGRPSAPR